MLRERLQFVTYALSKLTICCRMLRVRLQFVTYALSKLTICCRRLRVPYQFVKSFVGCVRIENPFLPDTARM
jgi:hypothetical protein